LSHTVIVEVRCQPSKGDEFLASLLPALEDTRAFAGCESIEAYVDQRDPDLVVLWEKWEEEEHHEAYMAWRIEEGLLARLAPLFDGDARVLHLREAQAR
jgi:quinol monooxygenase YgiN